MEPLARAGIPPAGRPFYKEPSNYTIAFLGIAALGTIAVAVGTFAKIPQMAPLHHSILGYSLLGGGILASATLGGATFYLKVKRPHSAPHSHVAAAPEHISQAEALQSRELDSVPFLKNYKVYKGSEVDPSKLPRTRTTVTSVTLNTTPFQAAKDLQRNGKTAVLNWTHPYFPAHLWRTYSFVREQSLDERAKINHEAELIFESRLVKETKAERGTLQDFQLNLALENVFREQKDFPKGTCVYLDKVEFKRNGKDDDTFDLSVMTILSDSDKNHEVIVHREKSPQIIADLKNSLRGALFAAAENGVKNVILSDIGCSGLDKNDNWDINLIIQIYEEVLKEFQDVFTHVKFAIVDREIHQEFLVKFDSDEINYRNNHADEIAVEKAKYQARKAAKAAP